MKIAAITRERSDMVAGRNQLQVALNHTRGERDRQIQQQAELDWRFDALSARLDALGRSGARPDVSP